MTPSKSDRPDMADTNPFYRNLRYRVWISQFKTFDSKNGIFYCPASRIERKLKEVTNDPDFDTPVFYRICNEVLSNKSGFYDARINRQLRAEVALYNLTEDKWTR